MFVVGLTGGIGSGKTTVANLFADHGVPIIDADQIARHITQPDKPAFQNILKHFGKEIVLADGTLDRTQLRHIIFSDSKQRLWLENLLHPIIRDEMKQQVMQLTALYCIAVIPLLLEVEFYSFINRILVVDASEEAQISRVIARDKSLKTQVEPILKTQANRADRKAHAHDIILNDGNLADLIPQVNHLHKIYTEMARRSSS